LADKCEHMTCYVPFCEPSAGVGKEILPLPLERFVVVAVTEPRIIFGHQVLRKVGFKTPAPFAQCSGIV
jgi:hypothetical protein